MINQQIKADMRNFLRSGFGSAWNPAVMTASEMTGPDAPPYSNSKMLSAAGLAEWTKTSGWARDTGGEIDPVTGAPVRAQVSNPYRILIILTSPHPQPNLTSSS